MKFEVQACDLGFNSKYGTCAIDTEEEGDLSGEVDARGRMARAGAGAMFLATAALFARSKMGLPIAALGGWCFSR